MDPNPRKSLKYRSFEVAYKKFALPLMKFVISKMGADKYAAEEVFSQTVEAALKSYHTFAHKSSFFTWICRIALNKMADYYRSQVHERSRIIAPTLEKLSQIKSPQLSPEEELSLKELKMAVYGCLMLLPPEKRRLLYLKYWKDLSHKEIGKILGLTERAVEGKLYRAKQMLKAIFLERYSDLVPSYSR